MQLRAHDAPIWSAGRPHGGGISMLSAALTYYQIEQRRAAAHRR